jgi:hypothetical protein
VLSDGRCGERLPAVDLTHHDLSRGEQRQNFDGGQHGLRLYPSFELLLRRSRSLFWRSSTGSGGSRVKANSASPASSRLAARRCGARKTGCSQRRVYSTLRSTSSITERQASALSLPTPFTAHLLPARTPKTTSSESQSSDIAARTS